MPPRKANQTDHHPKQNAGSGDGVLRHYYVYPIAIGFQSTLYPLWCRNVDAISDLFKITIK